MFAFGPVLESVKITQRTIQVQVRGNFIFCEFRFLLGSQKKSKGVWLWLSKRVLIVYMVLVF